jgi:hypothetical protein
LKGQGLRGSGKTLRLPEAERADKRRTISRKRRKLVEEVFGWAKGDSVLKQVNARSLKRVDWFYRFAMAACNIVRLKRLIPIQRVAGWGRSVSESRSNRHPEAKQQQSTKLHPGKMVQKTLHDGSVPANQGVSRSL